MSYPFILSILFLGISLIYTIIGFYGLSLNFKSKNNRLFFIMTISLSFWSTCYSMANATYSREFALNLNQMTVFGWGFFYSYIFHLIMMISSKKPVSKKTLAFLYAPSIFFVFSFYILDSSSKHFIMIESNLGFTTSSPPTFANNLFIFYALFYSLLAVRELILWHKRVLDLKIKYLIRLTAFSSVLAIVLSGLTDYFFRNVMELPLPQSTVIWLLLPVVSFFYLLLKSRFIHDDLDQDMSKIIDDRSKETVFKIFGYIYILIAYSTFYINYLSQHGIKRNQTIVSLIALIFAFVHMFLTSFVKKRKLQYMIITLLYVVIMTLTSYLYYSSLSITVWAFFFCYMVLVSIFESSVYGYFMYLYMIGIQLFTWFKHPHSVNVLFDWTDFFGRILFISLFSYLIFYINYAYKKKVRESVIQIAAQNTMKDFSSAIQNIDIHNTYETTIELLRILSEGFMTTRSYYVAYNEKDDDLKNLFYYENGDARVEIDFKSTVFHINEDWLNEVKKNKTVQIYNIFLEYKNKNEGKYQRIKDLFEARRITGFFALPIFIQEKIRGICAFEFTFKEESKLLNSYLEILNTLISEALERLDGQRKLFFRANYDSTTGLKNKEYFTERSNDIIQGTQHETFMLYIDIDNFKSINDTFGHAIGDKVLKASAQIFEENSPVDSLITRFTSDEFAMYFYRICSKEQIEEYCNKLIMVFREGVNVDGHKFRLNLSIGIAHSPIDGENADSLLKNAALALSSLKKFGYMKYHFCDDNDKQNTLMNSLYTDKLYNALDRNEFKLAFQAQIDTESEKIVGAEALLRWESKSHGLIPPFKFIPILEHTGLIISVGEWIIEECIRVQKTFEKEGFGDIRFSVNLSAAQFMDASLISVIRSLKEKYNVNPKNLEFEITESIAVNNTDFVMESFKSIKEMGFSIAIDDFGTGFSSLSTLQQLPIDHLKIDKSFVDGIGMSDKRESIVNFIIELSKILNLSCIAEGVESPNQVAYLKEHKCEEIQGYYYAKPMFTEEFKNFVVDFRSNGRR